MVLTYKYYYSNRNPPLTNHPRQHSSRYLENIVNVVLNDKFHWDILLSAWPAFLPDDDETTGDNVMSTPHYADSLTNYILNCVKSSSYGIILESFCINNSRFVNAEVLSPLSIKTGDCIWSAWVSLFVCYIYFGLERADFLVTVTFSEFIFYKIYQGVNSLL